MMSGWRTLPIDSLGVLGKTCSSLVEVDEARIGPSGDLMWLWNAKTIETVDEKL